MPQFRLTQHAGGDATTTRDIEASCIDRSGTFVVFLDSDHELLYSIREDLLHTVERIDNGKDAEPTPDSEPQPNLDDALPATQMLYITVENNDFGRELFALLRQLKLRGR